MYIAYDIPGSWVSLSAVTSVDYDFAGRGRAQPSDAVAVQTEICNRANLWVRIRRVP